MSNNEQLVSVVMPVFNGASTIRLALQSLVGQTYNNWECVVVNDGSTDDTIKVIQSISDSRIKLINLPENKGRGYARDVAVRNCSGKYLCYLDADDFLHHDKIYKQVMVLESNADVALVGCNRIQFNDTLIPLRGSASKCTNIVKYHEGSPLSLIMPSVMLRRERAIRYDYDKRLDVGEDVDYVSRYLDGANYTNINESLYFYRLANLSRKKLLYYAKEDIRRGTILFERNKGAGVRVIIVQSIKYVIYLIVSMFTGASFFLNRRGARLSREEELLFSKELERLGYKNTNIM